MRSRLALAVSLSLLVSLAAPAWAGSLQYFEDSLGSPGVTAVFAPGTGLLADIDYDASSAEGGSLLFGASEITIAPIGDAVLVSFVCQLAAGCDEGDNYTFTPGGVGVGALVVTDSDSNPQTGLLELGDITWNSLSSGGVALLGCSYTDPNAVEHSCNQFLLATTDANLQVPEPATGALVAAALAALGVARRRRA